MRNKRKQGLLIAVLLLVLASCNRTTTDEPDPAPAAPETSNAVMQTQTRNVFFGDLHLHSRWSFDAFSMNVVAFPEQVYRFSRGEPIDHISGKQIRLEGPPLDFIALTEHAEYLGVVAQLGDPSSPVSEVDLIKRLTSDDPATRGGALGEFAQSLTSGKPNPPLIEDDIIKPAWARLIELADEYYVPGEFTTFVGFEWTSMPYGNLHRNLIFRGNRVPDRPYSSFDSLLPEDLWTWMDQVREQHDDIVAIPHNGNMSDGKMYPLQDSYGQPLTKVWASARNRNEPVTEVMQIKGQSETLPALSPNDEWADFEVYNRSIASMTEDNEVSRGSYAREALRNGIRLGQNLGVNPYKMGMLGSTDGHNAAGPIDEGSYFGKLGVADGTVEQRLSEGTPPFNPDVVARWSAAGLAGVWAEANTREAIFDAIKRREVFSTSGTRIKVRFFAGNLQRLGSFEPGVFETAYRNGVPMGGEINGRNGPPAFLLWASRDPSSAPLQRLQVIKGWVEGDQSFETIIDVACAAGSPSGSPARCPGADIVENQACETLKLANGAAELKSLWQDPHFNQDQPAFYYVRVLETPTCRWSTLQSEATGIPVPPGIPRLIQERAVTSPIWYSP